MKKKYLGLAVTSTLAFSMLATSAFAVNNADTLDGLDSTDFALATHAHSTSDVTGLDAELATKADQSDLDTAVTILENADVNPMLPVNFSEPYTCGPTDVGAIALTSQFTACVCNGTDWVSTADGITSCDWKEDVVTSAGQVWMDRNLGASRVATSPTDSAAYGDLYQWGRGADGHQSRTSGTTSTLSSTDEPGHGNFIASGSGSAYDWRSPQNNDLWQGVAATTNPCPSGFRIPTKNELTVEKESWLTDDTYGAYESPLRFTIGGRRNASYPVGGTLESVGNTGHYWSSTIYQSSFYSTWYLKINAQPSLTTAARASGGSVRCILD